MSAISTDVNKIRNAVWADEVRESIAHGIEQCYSDVSNPTLQTDALEAALQTKIDEGEMAALTIGDGTITTSKIANGAITQAKLDPNISFEADDELDATSTNAVQNKVVAQAISEVNESLGNMETATAEDVGKALKAKTVAGGKVTEWEFGSAGSDDTFIESVPKNLINKFRLEEGSIDTSDGIVKARSNIEKSRWSSDFIPVQKTDIVKGSNLNVLVFYDQSKAFVPRTFPGTGSAFIPDGVSYVRVDFAKTNINTALLCHLEYVNETDDTVYVSVNETGRNLVTKTLPIYAGENSTFFYKTRNLFDYLNDHYYIKCQISGSTGEYIYNSYNSDIPDSTNAYITPIEYYPVAYGQTLFCNYYCWASAYYDANKDFLGAIPQRDAYVGWVVPEGCAYVRISVKGSNATPTPANAIGNLSEMRNVILYTLDTDQTIAPKPMEGLLPYQIDGKMIAPNYLDTVIPNMVQSEFLSAMRCMAIREVNRRDHAFRIGNFNMWVTVGRNGWYMARKMFMDYGLDFCGLEEVNTGADISKFMKSWQFPYGFDTNFSDGADPIDKSLLSRYSVISSRKLYTTSSGSSVALLNSKIQMPRLDDVYNASRILSVYVVHLPITSGATKISVANEILAFVANDTSDYIVIFGDTNDFGTTEEEKTYWRTFESSGFRPVIPITTKTVTQDNLGVVEGDASQNWRKHSIDQFLISSNIDAASYGVINTKDEYGLSTVSGTATDNEPALSDHDFVYVDLIFKDEVRQ